MLPALLPLAFSAFPALAADEAEDMSAPRAAAASDESRAEPAPADPDATTADEAPADMSRQRGGKRGGKRGERGERPQKGGDDDGREPPERARIWAHIRPVALAQVWVTAYDADKDPVADATGYGDPEDDFGFKIKRLRLGLKGKERGVDWAVVLGLTAPYDGFDDQEEGIEVIDAHVGYEWQGLGVSVGQGELPFSRDRMITSAEQTFTERGMIAEHIAPGRELGATLTGARWGAKVTLGAYNSGGSIFGDDNFGKTLLGRLEYTFGPADPYETWGGPKKLSFGVGGGAFYTDDVATSTLAYGADGILRVAGLTVMVDAAMANVSPTNTTLDVPGVWDQTTRRGLTAQIGYGIGAFEPAVKASFYEDSAVGGYTTILGGVVWHGLLDDKGRDRVRIGAGYQARLEDPAFDNDTVRLWAQVRP